MHTYVCAYILTHTCITKKNNIWLLSLWVKVKYKNKINKMNFLKEFFFKIQWPHSTLYSLCQTLVSHLNLNSWEKSKSSESKSYHMRGINAQCGFSTLDSGSCCGREHTHIHRGTGTHAARTHTDAHYSKHAGFARLLLPRQPVACSLRFLTSIKG